MRLLLLLVFLCTSAGCASRTSAVPPAYSSKEKSRMTFCVGIADTVRYVATEKLKGTPIEQVKSHYASKVFADLNLAATDKVYSEEFSSVWDYTVGYFEECSYQLAAIPAERITFGRYCLQNKLIADVALAYKASGAPREEAYAHFAKVSSNTAKAIIDFVYDGEGCRGETSLAVWDFCISQVTGD
jgi:hypothetical protein